MNVPHFEQELDYSCLAACTRMVLAFWGAKHTEPIAFHWAYDHSAVFFSARLGCCGLSHNHCTT